MPNKNQLKPCPFCGEKPVVKTGFSMKLTGNTLFANWSVGCSRCGVWFTRPAEYVIVLEAAEPFVVAEDGKAAAAAAWNRRN